MEKVVNLQERQKEIKEAEESEELEYAGFDKLYLGSLFETQLNLSRDGEIEAEILINEMWMDDEDRSSLNDLVNAILEKISEKYMNMMKDANK